MPASVTPLPRAWRDILQLTANGIPRSNLRNACLTFRDAPEFRGRIRFDQFGLRTMVTGPLPWDDEINRPWNNYDDTAAAEWIQQQDVQIGRDNTQLAIEWVAYQNKYHPVRDWLNSLEWDGNARIDDWLTYFLGVERTDYAQHIGKAWLVSAVARIFEPGCKADHVLILEGRQGVRKSTALRTLFSDQWFTDELADFGSKDAGMQMRGVWLIELAELDHLSRGDASRIKAFISRSTDRFRPPYGARLIEAPRECVFAGTVNQDEYLKDETGGRRFWPVRVGDEIDIDGLAAEREQIWAEALQAYRGDAPWWLTDREIEGKAAEQQAERRESDAWESPIAEWTRGEAKFTTTEVLQHGLKKNVADITDRDNKRVAKILQAMGFRRITVRRAGVTTKAWKQLDD